MRIHYQYDGENFIFKVVDENNESLDVVTELHRHIVSQFHQRGELVFDLNKKSDTYDVMYQGHPDIHKFVKPSTEINDSVVLRIWKNDEKKYSIELFGYKYVNTYDNSHEINYLPESD